MPGSSTFLMIESPIIRISGGLSIQHLLWTVILNEREDRIVADVSVFGNFESPVPMTSSLASGVTSPSGLTEDRSGSSCTVR